MKQIELNNGYMVCVTCRGYIEAGNMSPGCECLDECTIFTEQTKENIQLIN